MIRFRLGGWIAERQDKQSSAWLLLICFVTFYSPVIRCQQPVVETDISKYQTKVSGAKTYPAAEQGTIASYLGIEETSHNANACENQDVCPDVFLFDKPVQEHHNLGFDVIGYKDSSPRRTNAKAQIIVGYNDDDRGTALAGIIGARRGESGVIGVNPTAHIFSTNWDYYRSGKTQRKELTDTLAERFVQHTNHSAIIVFPTDWAADSGSSLDPCSQRQHGDILGNFLVSITTPLIVAAAGDVEKGGAGADIGRSYKMAPENMGDCENVIVVTACLECTSSAPKIPAWANFSTSGLVHIAAYGDPVLSTGSGDRLTILPASTSQSAAFVAGVASAMVSRWPKAYKDLAWQVKFRLQVSSTPMLTGTDALKIAAGVLNAELAFQNPDLDYLSAVTPTNNEDQNKKDYPTEIQGWCVDQIEISNDRGAPKEIIPVGDIARIYCSQINHCTIYHAENQQRRAGRVFRSGPGELIGHILAVGNGQSEEVDHRDAQVIFKADQKLFTPLQFTDLLLHDSKARLSARNCAP